MTHVFTAEIYLILNAWTFEHTELCQVTQFLNLYTALTSGAILFAIKLTRRVLVT